jgi:hypothetical protein
MVVHEQKTSSLLLGIFLVLLVGALAVDVISYWPVIIAGL